MRKVSSILLVVILALLTGCQGAKNQPIPTSETSTNPGTRSPLAPTGTALSTELSAVQKTSSPSAVTTVPAPGSDTGVVTGSFFSTKMNAPLSQIGVYLGEYMYLTPGPNYLVTIREKGSPHTLADDEGRFVIDKVVPGKYPIMLYTPFNSLVIPDPERKKELVIEVKPGQVTDVGEIRVEFP